jgi:hypothetical protein
MKKSSVCGFVVVLIIITISSFCVASSDEDTKTKALIISQATSGALTSERGMRKNDCGEEKPYSAEVVDLNNDGQPEVFTLLQGSCDGGDAGTAVNLYIKDKATGKWVPQFGFPGSYKILNSYHGGYPDIEIDGPGFCFPVWAWDGNKYSVLKKCS